MSSRWRRLRSGGEFDLIRAFARAAGEAVPGEERPGPGGVGDGSGRSGRESWSLTVPAGDDAVGISLPGGESLLLSTDATVEDVHFRRAWASWETVGRRAVAAALSDLAAMAARPIGALVTLMLPPELAREVAEALGAGVGEALQDVDGRLLGGDLVRTTAGVALDVVAVGSAARPVGRDGARPEDELWVTGELGGPASAVRDWTRGYEPDPRSRRAFARPTPRLREARWLAERVELRAMIDLSDGMGADAAQLAAASGCGVELDVEALPLAPALAELRNPELAYRYALTGGEDYELLLAVPPDALEPGLRQEFGRAFGIPLTRVGRAVGGEGVFVQGDGVDPEGLGYDHFPPPGSG